MPSSESEDELSHFKPSGLLYSNPENIRSTSAINSTVSSSSLNPSSSSSRSQLLKYYECEDACDPSGCPSTFKLFVFKGSSVVETIDLASRSYFRIGRDESTNHIHLLHESCSSQHAILQYRNRSGKCRLYVMDLDSSNGTTLNGEVQLEGKRFYEILDGDVVKFGASTRDYVFMQNKV